MKRASRSAYDYIVIEGSVGRGVALRGPEGERGEELEENLGN